LVNGLITFRRLGQVGIGCHRRQQSAQWRGWAADQAQGFRGLRQILQRHHGDIVQDNVPGFDVIICVEIHDLRGHARRALHVEGAVSHHPVILRELFDQRQRAAD